MVSEPFDGMKIYILHYKVSADKGMAKMKISIGQPPKSSYKVLGFNIRPLEINSNGPDVRT